MQAARRQRSAIIFFSPERPPRCSLLNEVLARVRVSLLPLRLEGFEPSEVGAKESARNYTGADCNYKVTSAPKLSGKIGCEISDTVQCNDRRIDSFAGAQVESIIHSTILHLLRPVRRALNSRPSERAADGAADRSGNRYSISIEP